MRTWRLLGFLLLIAWFGRVSGWRLLGLVLCAAAVHEAGHLAAMGICGVRPRHFTLSMFGAVIDFEETKVSYPQELLIYAAGPAADLLCGAILSLTANRSTENFCAAGAFWILGLFNLLPLTPLDGGQMLRLCACWAAGPEWGERATDLVSLICAGVLTMGIFAMMFGSGGSLWLLPAAFGAAQAAIQAGKRLKKV